MTTRTIKQLSYCGQLVRDHDADRFLLSMFAPSHAREDLWALFAFNHEIAKTREVVSETQLGLIRLQWWRERIADIYEHNHPQGNEVLNALAKAIHTHNLLQEHFELLIHAREFDLEDVLPGNVEGLLNYADFTATPLLKLAVRICSGDDEGEEGREPLQPVAINYALAGILRAVPFHAQTRRCLLPEDLMQKHHQRRDHLFEGKPAPELPQIIQTIASEAVKGVRCDNTFAKATNALAWIYLKHLKRNKYDVFSPKIQIDPPLKVLRIFMNM